MRRWAPHGPSPLSQKVDAWSPLWCLRTAPLLTRTCPPTGVPCRDPIPVMALARLAVDSAYQKLGFGSALLRDALLRTDLAVQSAGIRACAASCDVR